MDDKKTDPQTDMAHRFSGAAGVELLLDVLADTSLLRGMPELNAFISDSEILSVAEGAYLITQGDADNFIYIVISGAFDVLINGRFLATRRVGSHLGEMALVDPTSRRSASVVASEPSVVLKCSEPSFTAYANHNPKVWRRIAVELSRRLTERNRLIPQPRSEPVLFIGCSTEALPIAREIQAGLDHDPIVVEIWTEGVFNASSTPIEDLTELLTKVDFGVMLLTPDDKVTSRDIEIFGPRDNVIFELGLLIGAIGRERTFVVTPRGQEFKIPSDLLGVRPIDYPPGSLDTIRSRLGPACNELRKIVSRLGPI